MISYINNIFILQEIFEEDNALDLAIQLMKIQMKDNFDGQYARAMAIRRMNEN